MPSPEEVRIASGPFTARIRPAWGGRMTHLAHAEFGDLLVPTKAEVFESWNWPKAGAYPLFPYHNRIYGARFTHAGKQHVALPHPALAPDAMHGPSHRRPWRVVSQSLDRAVLALVYDADNEWPFSFEAQQAFSLTPQGLAVELTITNRADVSAPAAIGWHPYVSASLDREAWTDAQLAYPLDEHDVPTGASAVARTIRDLPATSGYTKHLSNWSNAQIHLNDGFSLSIEADPVLNHLAVHRTETYLCIEPVSIAAGTLNLPEDERAALGLKMLDPGQSLSGRIRLGIKRMF